MSKTQQGEYGGKWLICPPLRSRESSTLQRRPMGMEVSRDLSEVALSGSEAPGLEGEGLKGHRYNCCQKIRS